MTQKVDKNGKLCLYGKERNFTAAYKHGYNPNLPCAHKKMYDAENRRFIAIGPIKDGLNWYVYCDNNPIKYIDPFGTDAIWLTDTTRAARHGHAAVAFQDAAGNWWLMSYEKRLGSLDDIAVILYRMTNIVWNQFNTRIVSAQFEIPTSSQFQSIHDPATIYWNPEEGYFYRLSCFYNYNAKGEFLPFTTYNHQVYIVGDFSGSLKLAKEYADKSPGYWVTSQNCAWVALRVLYEGITDPVVRSRVHDRLWDVRITNHRDVETPLLIVPNKFRDEVSDLFRGYGRSVV